MTDASGSKVLASRADDYELFSFPFIRANFGHQICVGRSDPGQEPGRPYANVHA